MSVYFYNLILYIYTLRSKRERFLSASLFNRTKYPFIINPGDLQMKEVDKERFESLRI